MSQAEDIPWNQHFQEGELRKMVKQDVERTSSEFEFSHGNLGQHPVCVRQQVPPCDRLQTGNVLDSEAVCLLIFIGFIFRECTREKISL